MQPSPSAPSLALLETASGPRLRSGLPMRLSAWLSVSSSKSPLARRIASYVRLDGEVLSVHADQFALPSDELDLRRTSVDYSLNKSARRDFRVLFSDRVFVFKCDSFEQMKTWATSIQHATCRCFDLSYTLGALLAEGSHSKVYTAYPLVADDDIEGADASVNNGVTSQVYAVKVIKRRSHDVGEVTQLGRERRIAVLLPPHPNVVQPVDVFATGDRVHIVMELMRGGTLADLLQRHPRLPEPHARVVMRNVFAALVHLHANHIVHRDIRPENVFCSEHRFPMELALGDFGDANFVSDLNGQERVNRDVLSSMTGDPLYMASEIVRREKYGPAVDLWSAGVLMFRLLSGNLPFTGLSTRAVYDAVSAGTFCMETPSWRAVSPSAKSLVRQLLQTDPHKRISAVAAAHHHWLLPPGPPTSGVHAARPLPMPTPFTGRSDAFEASQSYQATLAGRASHPRSSSPRPSSCVGVRHDYVLPSSSHSSSSSDDAAGYATAATRGVSAMVRDLESTCVGIGECESPFTTDGSSSSLCADSDPGARAKPTSRRSGRAVVDGLSGPSINQEHSALQPSLRALRPTSSNSSLAALGGGSGVVAKDVEQPRLVVTPSLRKIHEVGLHEATRDNPQRMHRLLSNRVMKQQLSTLLPGRHRLVITARAFIAVFRILALVRGHSLTRQLSVIEEDERVGRADRVNEIVDKRKAFHVAKDEVKEKEGRYGSFRPSVLPRNREDAAVNVRDRPPARHLPKLLQRNR